MKLCPNHPLAEQLNYPMNRGWERCVTCVEIRKALEREEAAKERLRKAEEAARQAEAEELANWGLKVKKNKKDKGKSFKAKTKKTARA